MLPNPKLPAEVYLAADGMQQLPAAAQRHKHRHISVFALRRQTRSARR